MAEPIEPGAGPLAADGDEGEACHARATGLLQDYAYRGDEGALAAAVELLRPAADTTAGGPHRPGCLTTLSRALRLLAAVRDDTDMLAEAIGAGRAAVAASEHQPAEDRAVARNQLALALWAWADETGADDDRRATLTELRSAAAELPCDSPLSARYTGNLGLALRDEFLLTGDSKLIKEAVTALRSAYTVIRADDPDLSAIESNLALALQDQCERTGDATLLDEGITLLETAITRTEPDDPWRSTLLANLSAMYQDRYELLTDPAALAEAVRLAQAAVDSDGDSHRHAGHLTHLGLALRMSYEHSGAAGDLDRAVDVSRKAVDVAGPEHSGLAIYLSNLGIALMASYNRGGDPQVLEESIAMARQATLAKPQGGYRRPSYLSNLAPALWTRYARTGEMSTLDEAIGALREAAASTEPGSPDQDRYAANLGLALWSRCERTYDDDMLAEAVGLLRDVVARTGPEHVEHVTYVSNLGEAFHLRFRNRGAPSDLNTAINMARVALADATDDHVDKVRFGSNLGVLLQTRYQRAGDAADLRTAIELFREAVARTTDGHPDEGLYRFNLGDALRQLAASEADPIARKEAYAQLTAAAATSAATPSLRVEAGWAAGCLAADAGDFAAASSHLAEAVEMLQRVAPVHLQLTDSEHQLGQFLGLVSDAAACLLRCGRAADALAVLEDGRGTLLEQALQQDPAVAELRASEPDLAERLSWLRSALDPHLPVTALGAEQAEAAETRDRRHARHAEWYQLLAEIRSKPGLERFLLPPLPDSLMSADRSSPVVVVNISRYGSDALVAADGQVRVIPLPLAEPGVVAEHAQALRGALFLVLNTTGASQRSAERRFNSRFRDAARWLSAAITSPVLGDLVGGESKLDSVCWSPTGLLTILPLHAADSGEALVHCYSPTIRATLRTGLPPPDGALPAVVASISAGLPATATEADTVGALLDAVKLRDEAASVTAVAGALQESAIAHLAIHALNDPVSASRGHLELSDGTLSIAQIIRLQPRRPWLAYLSACDTANTGAAIPDQSVTVASAFNLIGYPNVVGTLWPAHDETAAQIARRFYTELRLSGGVPTVSPAVALHLALRSVRQSLPDRPLLWAPYLFIGRPWPSPAVHGRVLAD